MPRRAPTIQAPIPDDVSAHHPARRDCPTLPGDGRSLITHRIDAPLCSKRQNEHYHRCHRCVYRGRPLDWTYDLPAPFTPAASGSKAKPKVGRAKPVSERSAGA
ncbi:MAG: hypothetical protein IPM29_31525 [Planctomycetes bacterium]|nr:hypothetical protein [Planctomycetota bacterium]